MAGNPTEPRSRSRSQSKARSEKPTLQRIHTGRHIDAQSLYNDHDYHGEQAYVSDTETEVGKEDKEKAREEGEGEIPEMRDGIPNEKDLEGAPIKKEPTRQSTTDPNLVTWDGPDDPANPKNWSFKRKWAATVVVSLYTLISPVSSSMVAPALPAIAHTFNVTQSFQSQLTVSIFVLAYAVGPLFIAPFSEMNGRAHVLQLANLFYLAFNIACGVSQSEGQLLAFRFLSGLGGSAPLAIGGGVLSDLFTAEQRGRAIAIYSLAPLLGPAVGPIAGGFIAENVSWRWVFYSTSIATVLIQLFGLLFLRETYAPQLLHKKAKQLRKETGNNELKTEYENPERTFAKTLSRSLVRPFRLLGTQPIVQVLALYMAFQYGLLYLLLSTFSSLFVDVYHESVGISGLNYLSVAVGCLFGGQVCAPYNDKIYRYYKNKNNGVGKPEFRILLMIVVSPLLPVGLFIYGWSAEYHTHWIVPNIGIVLFATGLIVTFQCIQTYLIDTYSLFAASAIGSATVLRSLAGFGFPLFAPAMYNALGYGWGNSLLAFFALGMGIPAPILLWFYGEKLRKRSPFAAGG